MSMENLSSHLADLHANYRKIFLEYSNSLLTQIVEIRPKSLEGGIFDKYSKSSDGNIWQLSVLKLIDSELSKIPNELQAVKDLRKNFHCACCGVCCKFAVSEFSPVELKQKANQGDNFAIHFIKTFVPYENIDEVKKVFPQYVEFLQNSETDEKYYFYHCLKVTRENKCPDYEKRPQICRDFPDNPIAFLPLLCGYMGWKQKTEIKMLELNAKSEILHFYKTKLLEIV